MRVVDHRRLVMTLVIVANHVQLFALVVHVHFQPRVGLSRVESIGFELREGNVAAGVV